MKRVLANVMVLFGGTVLAVLLAGRLIEVAVESYTRDGWLGLAAGIIVLGSIVALIVGLLMRE